MHPRRPSGAPLTASTHGAVGCLLALQVTAELIRALSTGTVTRADLLHVCRDELFSGVAAGAVLFVVAMLRTGLTGECNWVEATTVAAGVFFMVLLAAVLSPLVTFALHTKRMSTEGGPPCMLVLVALFGTAIVCMLLKRLL